MPKPKEGETKDEYMKRCVPMLVDEGREQDQAVAICNSMWEGKSLDDGALVYYGGEVKTLGGGKVGGYLVRFTDELEPDLELDFFDGATKFGGHLTSPIYYNHGLDPEIGRRVLGTGALEAKDAGVWIEAQLELRDEYEQAIYALAEKGKLGWSSGTAPHLVEREKKGNAYHVLSWPLGLDASLTPTPADPGNRAMPLKAWAESVKGLSLEAPAEEGVKETPSGGATVTVSDASTVHVHVHQKAVEEPTTEDKPMSEETKAQAIDWDAYHERTERMVEGKFTELEGRITDKLTPLLDALAKAPALKDAGYVSPDSEKNERAKMKSFGDFLLAIRNGNHTRLRDVYKSVKALGEQSGTAGGYLVPEDYIQQLMQMAMDAAVVRPLATVIPVGTNRGSLPALNQSTAPTAGVGQSAFAGGVRAYWTAEEGTLTSTEPSFTEIEYNINDLGGYTEVSNNLISDSPFAIESILTMLFGRAIAAKEDYAFIRGTGAGEPLGILAAPCTIGVTTNADNTWSITDALNILAQFQPVSSGTRSISWVLHRGLLPDFESGFDVSTGGIDWVQPREGLPGSILGYPMRFSEHMPAPNTDDAMLCDFSAYLIFDREGLQIDYSEHAAFTSRKGTWRFVKRLDGQPWLTSSITLADPGGATTVSPFVYHND